MVDQITHFVAHVFLPETSTTFTFCSATRVFTAHIVNLLQNSRASPAADRDLSTEGPREA